MAVPPAPASAVARARAYLAGNVAGLGAVGPRSRAAGGPLRRSLPGGHGGCPDGWQQHRLPILLPGCGAGLRGEEPLCDRRRVRLLRSTRSAPVPVRPRQPAVHVLRGWTVLELAAFTAAVVTMTYALRPRLGASWHVPIFFAICADHRAAPVADDLRVLREQRRHLRAAPGRRGCGVVEGGAAAVVRRRRRCRLPHQGLARVDAPGGTADRDRYRAGGCAPWQRRHW